MNWEEAIKYCEEHECIECEIHLKDKDKRTRDDKCNRQEPCCINLVSDERNRR